MKKTIYRILIPAGAAICLLTAVLFLCIQYYGAVHAGTDIPFFLLLRHAAVPFTVCLAVSLALSTVTAFFLSRRIERSLSDREAVLEQKNKELGVATETTEREKAETLRRQFTANVSHELKTPLQCISGYAELLSDGMVQPEDIPRFSKIIHDEAHRMIVLVDDIIRISHLEEGTADMPCENTDLFALADSTLKSLLPAAERADVTLHLEGESTPVYGVSQLLSVIIFNLCDNAIKYNKRGGTVTVRTETTEAGAVLTVRDTGIGIPEGSQDRIFERFYRVDKSRSKEVGGTGLGLSIVKHAAILHHAAIYLESRPNVGTAITVTFPTQ